MTSHDFIVIQRLFTQCFKDAAVFERYESDGNFFESNDIQKAQKRWLVVAAGLEDSKARDLFSGHPKRAEKVLAPLRSILKCEMSVLFLVRPFDGDLSSIPPTDLVVPFAPKRGMPWIEMREAYIKVWNLPDNNNKLNNLRWEWDVVAALEEPFERWLRCWKGYCGFNPAHPPSHLHLNSVRFESEETGSTRSGDMANDLRLAVGNPNPLALILSIAAWLRSLLY